MSLKDWRRPEGRAVVRRCLRWTPWLVLAGVVALRADRSPGAMAVAQTQADALARQAYQVLKANCFECHGDAKRGGLDLRTPRALIAGGATGKVVVAHDPEKSRLYQYAVTEHEGRVAARAGDAKIAEPDLDTLRAWIEAGGSLDGRRSEARRRPTPSEKPKIARSSRRNGSTGRSSLPSGLPPSAVEDRRLERESDRSHFSPRRWKPRA